MRTSFWSETDHIYAFCNCIRQITATDTGYIPAGKKRTFALVSPHSLDEIRSHLLFCWNHNVGPCQRWHYYTHHTLASLHCDEDSRIVHRPRPRRRGGCCHDGGRQKILFGAQYPIQYSFGCPAVLPPMNYTTRTFLKQNAL